MHFREIRHLRYRTSPVRGVIFISEKKKKIIHPYFTLNFEISLETMLALSWHTLAARCANPAKSAYSYFFLFFVQIKVHTLHYIHFSFLVDFC